MFKPTGKQMGGVSVSWAADDDRLADGGNKYFGDRIVGKFLDVTHIDKGKKSYTIYDIKLYADFDDESKFGQEPEGETVKLWGTTVIDNSFQRGTDGTGIKPGDIVEVIYHGKKETADGANTYQNFTVNAFTPSPSFKAAGATATTGPAPKTVGAATKKSKELTDLGY